MNYTIEATAANEVTITIGTGDLTVTLEPNKIVPLTHVEEEADITISPDVTPSSNVYSLTGSDGDEYVITFAEDGVYKLYTEEDGVSYIHIFICISDLDEWLYDKINSVLCLSGCTSTTVCSCSANCTTYYPFNIVALISMTFFGESNLGVAFDYNEVSGGYLYAGYYYKCTDAGSGVFDWRYNGSSILVDSSGNAVTTGQLEEDETYFCTATGVPTNWGSVEQAVVTGLTDEYTTKLNYISDSIDRFERYTTESTNCDCQ